ncbi:MAG TPA: hypothetical protein VLA28_08420 [Afifellaceae bacterium]|nr:hypothetical protein [Afifellaceae bacterium]
METIRSIAQDAAREIREVVASSLTDEQAANIESAVEKAVIRGLLEGQHRAVDAALQFPEADQDLAHKIATAIRKKIDLLIVNLSSMR